MNIFSVETVFFTILDYPVSFIEFFGTVMYFSSVWLIARKNVFTWPVGIVSVALYMILFYQFALYSDVIEQVYFLFASAYGWLAWNRIRSKETVVQTGFSSPSAIVVWAIATLALGMLLGLFTSNLHILLPEFFPVEASLPFLDAITTAMSFTAMWLLAIRKAESWIYWILVDLAAIYIYFSKGIAFIGLQYILLTGMAVYGLAMWIKGRNAERENSEYFSMPDCLPRELRS
jgi:nicotinamide mononucleotide transporter